MRNLALFVFLTFICAGACSGPARNAQGELMGPIVATCVQTDGVHDPWYRIELDIRGVPGPGENLGFFPRQFQRAPGADTYCWSFFLTNTAAAIRGRDLRGKVKLYRIRVMTDNGVVEVQRDPKDMWTDGVIVVMQEGRIPILHARPVGEKDGRLF